MGKRTEVECVKEFDGCRAILGYICTKKEYERPKTIKENDKIIYSVVVCNDPNLKELKNIQNIYFCTKEYFYNNLTEKQLPAEKIYNFCSIYVNMTTITMDNMIIINKGKSSNYLIGIITDIGDGHSCYVCVFDTENMGRYICKCSDAETLDTFLDEHEKILELSAEIGKLKGANETIREENKKISAEIVELKGANETLREENKKLCLLHNITKDKYKDLQENHEELQRNFIKLQNSYMRLKNENENEKNNMSGAWK